MGKHEHKPIRSAARLIVPDDSTGTRAYRWLRASRAGSAVSVRSNPSSRSRSAR